ncbi:MAG: hypothetical protein JWO52_5156 [Gammaproteobacteria bacterium]|jgi:hypothetical protein|nr:hypothetical protein [Gammaproteobacteria bacterium]
MRRAPSPRRRLGTTELGVRFGALAAGFFSRCFERGVREVGIYEFSKVQPRELMLFSIDGLWSPGH